MFPTLSSLPKSMALNAATGFIYGYLFKANPKVAACAFAIQAFVETLAFAIANPLFRGEGGVRSLKIYTLTTPITMTASIIAFRQLKLIGTLGTIVFAGLTLLNMKRLISIIQLLEEQKNVAG